jgi:uncharacterized protein YndB with AHSA1/START domain
MSEPLEVSVHIAARPEIVYGYFTDPTRYAQWMGNQATLEPVPGGIYRVGMRDGMAAAGRFVDLDPPHRLVFTWGWTNDPAVPPGSTRVEVTLTAENGGTRVVLRHYDLPDPDQIAHHDKGWQLYLARLGTRATGGDPGPDPIALRDAQW